VTGVCLVRADSGEACGAITGPGPPMSSSRNTHQNLESAVFGPRSGPCRLPAAPAGHGRLVRACRRDRSLSRSVGRRAIGFAVCVIGTVAAAAPSPAGATRSQAVGNRRPRARRIDRRDQFVSGHVRAPGRVLMVPDVTIPRRFAGTRLGYPPPDGVWGGWRQGKPGGDRVLPREVLSRLTGPVRPFVVAYVLLHGV
jgi:hypothetical protein